MSAPDVAAVSWRTVLRVLDSHTTASRRRAIVAASLGPDGLDVPHALAGLVTVARPWQLRGALAAATWRLPGDELGRLHTWTARTASLYFGRHAPHRRDATPAATTVDPATPGLHMDDGLTLPLLDLARDIARRQQAGRLTVARASMQGANGRYVVWTGGAVIHLDLDNIAASGRTVADTWAHELSHALDPDRHGGVAPAEAERFANTLGPLLLEHTPATAADAAPLVAAALADRPADAGGITTVLDEIADMHTWRELDLSDRRADTAA